MPGIALSRLSLMACGRIVWGGTAEAGLSPLYLTAWGLVALGGILLLSLVGRVILAAWRRFQPLNVWARYAEEASPHRRRRRGWGVLGAVLLLLLGLLLVGAGLGLFLLDGAVQAYLPFPTDKPVASVRCSPGGEATGEPMTCHLTLTGTESYTATVQGVRWTIEGEVLVWDPALERFGLRSGYRLLRLVGYDSVGRIVTDIGLPSASGGLGTLFEWLGDRFPFVHALQQAVSDEVVAGMHYDVSVSHTGFSLKKWEPVQP